jgi:HAD superfamily hydrolase (TIGR01509 family)
MPIAISCAYTFSTWQKNLKITYATGTVASIMWVIYDTIVGAYAATIGTLFETVSSLIGLYKLIKIDQKKKAQLENQVTEAEVLQEEEEVEVKGIIFDFNGTLFWDGEIQENAWRTFASNLAGREITDEEFKLHFHGRTNKDTLEYITGKTLTQEEVDKLAQGKEEIYRELCKKDPTKFVLAPGVEKFLDHLKSKNVPFTIATASEINNVTFFIEELKLDRWFDKTKIVYDDGTFKGKPEPDIYLKAASAIGISPTDCIVFEDAKSGVLSATNAGVPTIYAIVPSGRQNHFENNNNVIVIHSFEDKNLYDIEQYK